MIPVIGITTAWSFETYPHVKGDDSFIYAGKSYLEPVYQCGGTPVMLVAPFAEASSDNFKITEIIDGLIVTGGGSGFSHKTKVTPYPRHRDLRKQQPNRYKYESNLIKEAWACNLPVLGICRGHQMLAEALGGSMKTDYVPSHAADPASDHQEVCHEVTLLPSSRISSICNCTSWLVNSYHTQTVQKEPPGFVASAWSKDGHIESIEAIDRSFFMGVQFHPEKMFYICESARRLFETFIQEALIFRGGKQSSC